MLGLKLRVLPGCEYVCPPSLQWGSRLDSSELFKKITVKHVHSLAPTATGLSSVLTQFKGLVSRGAAAAAGPGDTRRDSRHGNNVGISTGVKLSG